MPATAATPILYVTYEGGPDTGFDRDYYVAHHLPLVRKVWGPLGLTRAAAFFPAESAAGTIAICECRFRDEAAVAACFASPETAEIMADVPRFTTVVPVRSRLVAL